MAAAIKALNAKIRANPVTDYFCSTHFWGPASNFGIPIAAVMDTQKDPEIISGRMTAALCGYSAVFMRYAMAVTPQNYLLFGCHLVNFTAQSTQAYRFVNYWYMGGREKTLEGKAKEGLAVAENTVEGIAGQAQELAAKAQNKAGDLAGEAKKQVDKATR
ncbi:hypothetical protein M409DRAFT_21003 [Zasmidium cellare ATCC 36951]|uniref:Mitochondrial pyruvate carrier n=1 Tax=Zasmidium cellare ATCC 36951 TaxID=1080233 RepID=A0A6A6CT31_ZASCE|nr:uncharacterized protein M409DRAFT_21003 [Zasmidium cellare ATCC 36951]KAF2168992.1 hypothetical protein M409DRAFT_21003 [Zasmidium cellare ATCC 36951]